MRQSSTFDFRDMHANISTRASENILERFQKPPLLLACFVLGAAHAIYLLVKKYLNYRVCLKLVWKCEVLRLMCSRLILTLVIVMAVSLHHSCQTGGPLESIA
jgi:hypothetical protein